MASAEFCTYSREIVSGSVYIALLSSSKMSFPMTTRSPGEAEAPVPVMAGEADGWRAARFTDRAFRRRRRECVMERTCLLPLGRRPRQIHLGQGRRPESSLSEIGRASGREKV